MDYAAKITLLQNKLERKNDERAWLESRLVDLRNDYRADKDNAWKKFLSECIQTCNEKLRWCKKEAHKLDAEIQTMWHEKINSLVKKGGN